MASAVQAHAQWLERQPDDVLVALLTRRPEALVVPPADFPELAARLGHQHACEVALGRLDATCGQVAGLVSACGGRADLPALLGLLPAAGPEVADELRPVLAELERWGLVWDDGPDTWCCADGVRALGRRLLTGTPPGDLLREPPLDPQPAGPEAAARAADVLLTVVDQVRALLRLLDEAPARPLQSGGLGVKEQRRIAKAMDLDVERCAWLLDLAGAAGLLSARSYAGRLTEQADDWAGGDDVAAALALVAAVLHDPAGPRVDGDPAPVLMGYRRAWSGTSLAEVAAPLVAAGAARVADDAVLRWLAWRHPGRLLAPSADPERLAQLDRLGLRAAGVAAPWLRALLAQDDRAQDDRDQDDRDQDDRAQDDRAQDDGAAAALLAEAFPPAQADAVWQADGTAVVAGRPDPALRRLLDAVARREGEHTWRVDPEQVARALDEGWLLAELLDGLAARSRHPLPQVLEQRVRDVAAQHGRVRLTAAGTVLQVDDPVLVAALLHDRSLRALSLVELVPGVLVSPHPAGRVWTALHSAGHAPVGDGAPPPPPRRAGPRAAATPDPPWAPPPPATLLARLRAAPRREPRSAPAADPRPLADSRQLLERTKHLSAGERVLLLRAVREGQPVQLDYVDAGGNPTTRVVERLEDTGGLLEGWCHLRGDERSFDPRGIVSVRPC